MSTEQCTATDTGDRGGREWCQQAAVGAAVGVCVHEHISRRAGCPVHLERAEWRQYGLRCDDCYEIDGHDCLLSIKVELFEANLTEVQR